MKKKLIYIVIAIAIIALLAVISFNLIKIKKQNDENARNIQNSIPSNIENVEDTQIISKYLKEEKLGVYNYRILESENKDYLTLFIEANVFEEARKIKITYNSSKLILDTGSPLLDKVGINSIEEDSSKKYIEIDLNSLDNYSIMFAKINSKKEITADDIVVEESKGEESMSQKSQEEVQDVIQEINQDMGQDGRS